jgi:hypothetical protein
LTKNIVLMGLKTASGTQMVFKSLNIQYQVATLLSYCKARDLFWDPKKDILFLCKNENEDVRSCRGQLNIKHVKELFLGTSFFSRLSPEDQYLCYRTLLDTDPPPTMSVTPPAPQITAQPKSKPEGTDLSTDATSPRSRYRNANGHQSSSNGLPTTQNAKPLAMEQAQDTKRTSRIQDLQCVQSAKPHTVSTETAARKAHKSMPNLVAVQDIASAPFPGLQASKIVMDKQQQPIPTQNTLKLSPQIPSGSRQVQVSSTLEYGGAFRPAYIQKGDENAVANQAPPTGRKSPPHQSAPPRSDSTGTLVEGLQSQKGSLHVVSPGGQQSPPQQYFERKDTLERGRLRLVGPEGIYGAPENPSRGEEPQGQRQRHHSAPPPIQNHPGFVFELDAVQTPTTTFIAELPADPVVSSSSKPHTAQIHGAPSLQAPAKPSNPRTQSEPHDTGSLLPASLAIGGPGAQTHRLSLSHPPPSNEQFVEFSTRKTNAYRYSAFVHPQAAIPGALRIGFAKEETPSYKPYRPFIFTDELDRNDSVSSNYSPKHRHKRDASDDSTASHDSSKLAKEYQDLLGTEEGYGRD